MVERKYVLPDTSVWIDHFRGKTDIIDRLYYDLGAEIVLHPMVLAELVLSGINKEQARYQQLKQQRMIDKVSDEELIACIFDNDMACSGIGYVDCNLIASCLVCKTKLVTLDNKLAIAADRCDVLFEILE